MSTTSSNATPCKPRSIMRALRPFLVWFIGSLLLFGWYFGHRMSEGSTLTFEMLLEGQTDYQNVTVTLDGKPFKSGDKARVGKRRFLIEGPETEPFEKRMFVGLGEIELGTINLVRSKGSLVVAAKPAPNDPLLRTKLM